MCISGLWHVDINAEWRVLSSSCFVQRVVSGVRTCSLEEVAENKSISKWWSVPDRVPDSDIVAGTLCIKSSNRTKDDYI